MSDELPTSPFAPLPDMELTREEKRTIALLLAGLVTAFVVAEFVHLVERRLSRRHPLLAEMVEGASSLAPRRR